MKIKKVLAAVCACAVALSPLVCGLVQTSAETVRYEAEENKPLSVLKNVRKDTITTEDGFVKDCIRWDEMEEAYGYFVRVCKGGEEAALATYYDPFVEYRRFFYDREMDFGEYTFEICAFDKAQNSGEWSEPITVVYEPTLEAKLNVRLNEDGDDIYWDAVEGAVRYNYRILGKDREYSYRDWKEYINIYSNNFGWRVNEESGEYTVEIQAMDKNYNVSAWSEPLLYTYIRREEEEPVEIPGPEAPKNVRLDESGNTVLWDAVEGADKYSIDVEFYGEFNGEAFGAYSIGTYSTEPKYENWRDLVYYPFSTGKYSITIRAYADSGASAYSEALEVDFTSLRDEAIPLPEKVWLEEDYLYWDEIEEAKGYMTFFSMYSKDGKQVYTDNDCGYGYYIYHYPKLPAGAYEAEIEIVVIDENDNFNSKKYTVEIEISPDEAVWVPKLYYKYDDLLWDWDRLRYGNTEAFWIRIKKNDGTLVELDYDYGNSYSLWRYDLENGDYTAEVCVVDRDEDWNYRIGNWSEPRSLNKHGDSFFDDENESTSEVEQAPEADKVPDDDRILSITVNPAFNMKNKHDENVEFDLSNIRVKAKEIYDEEGLKRAEEALGEKIVGNKHYNLLDLTLWEGDRDISNGYDGLVQVIIPLPKGHRNKTFSCYRLTEIDGKMTKEVIPGEQTEDSYIIYLEHFSTYALVADGGEEEDEEDDEDTYSDWEYELLEDGTAEITAYKGKESELKIPKSIDGVSVTKIKDHVFSGCGYLTSVTIPNGVTSIGDGAFEKCVGLTSVTIPDSVTSISVYAFEGCSGLTSVTIPNGLTSISNGVFYGCGGLTSVTIPNSVTSIGDGAFERCGGLTSVTIPNSVTSIGTCAFAHCSSLTSVTIPNSVTNIGATAFHDCSALTSVTIPSSVTVIDVKALGYILKDNSYVKVPNFTICGYPGTASEAYAKENGFAFVEIKEGSGETPPEQPSDDKDYSDVASGRDIPITFIAIFLLTGLAVIAAGAVVVTKAFRASAESRR
ncbi:MAG: leucine-rich repeat domain-containing protein [Butyrivibrio sp.]|nr:leucine-rich repeat domain-containing protein [Butyrivibrio sp.]